MFSVSSVYRQVSETPLSRGHPGHILVPWTFHNCYHTMKHDNTNFHWWRKKHLSPTRWLSTQSTVEEALCCGSVIVFPTLWHILVTFVLYQIRYDTILPVTSCHGRYVSSQELLKSISLPWELNSIFDTCVCVALSSNMVNLSSVCKQRIIITYSYFEKGCRKKCARDNPER